MNDSKPTPGAMRAAQRFAAERFGLSNQTILELAKIIDEETGVPDLLSIVRVIAECDDYSELHMDEIGAAARAAISKAKGAA